MSKDRTPEVGDVWIDLKTKAKLRVLCESVYSPNTFDCLRIDGKSVDKVISCAFWKDYYAYLGHSKASIDDLFKTEKSND